MVSLLACLQPSHVLVGDLSASWAARRLTEAVRGCTGWGTAVGLPHALFCQQGLTGGLPWVCHRWAIATPWQGGTRHINNRDPSEVIAVLTDLGYVYDKSLSEAGRSAASRNWFRCINQSFNQSLLD